MLKSYICVFAIVLLALAPGCVSTGRNFDWSDVDRIEVGMSYSQVTGILGTPDEQVPKDDLVVCTWTYVRTPIFVGSSVCKSVGVAFKNNQVVNVARVTENDLPAPSGGSPQLVSDSQRGSVVVSSTIIKRVPGKYRYFFDIRNYTDEPFGGTVEITIHNKQPGVIDGIETFNARAIPPGLGAPVYMGLNSTHKCNSLKLG